MKTTITLSIEELESLIKKAKEANSGDYIPCVEITVNKPRKYHGESDEVDASLLSGWAECNNKWFYTNKK